MPASFDLPPGATLQGQAMHGVWIVFTIAGAVVAAIVYGLIFWSLIRYRRRDGASPAQFRGNPPLEMLYTAIPVAIVVALFIISYRTEAAVERLAPKPALTVEITAFRWSWRFGYVGTPVSITGTPEQPPQLVLPTGETVHIVLQSADVMHAMWVPAFLFKRDAIPGMKNQFDWNIQREGVYRGNCAEFCGFDHYQHHFTVKAVPARVFEQWLRDRGLAARRTP